MQTMRPIVIALTLLVQGCASDVFHVPDAFTDAQVETMQTEADRLCEASGDCYELTREDAPNKIRLAKPGELPHSLGRTNRPASKFGTGDWTIIIRDPSIALAATMRHEFGHVAGCHRHLDYGNVMAPDDAKPNPMDYTKADLACMTEQ